MSKVAFLFPGQGSQVVGMGQDIASNPTYGAFFEEADEVLGFTLSDIIRNGSQDVLTQTYHAQPALLTTSIALYTYVQQSGIRPDYFAGHSLGEYSALVAAGSISFRDAVHTVYQRGKFMESAVPNKEGTMAAILGADTDQLEQLANEISAQGTIVQLANLNCPGQIVVSGSRAGVEQMIERCKEAGAKRAIPLDVSGPFHSRLMEPAAASLGATLDNIRIQDCNTPVIANVNAQPMVDADTIKKQLIAQLYSPVRWEESIRTLIGLGVTTFVEIGPGKVLSGLVKKIDANVSTYAISDIASYDETIRLMGVKS